VSRLRQSLYEIRVRLLGADPRSAPTCREVSQQIQLRRARDDSGRGPPRSLRPTPMRSNAPVAVRH